jgi:hypothetical protein
VIEETYEPWYCNNISKPMTVSLASICCHTSEGMNICVFDTNNRNNKVKIHFQELPIATRITNESQRLVTLTRLPQGFSHFINIVQNSNFISWLNSESLQIHKNDPWIHFCIIADDEWIDLIASDFPEIII